MRGARAEVASSVPSRRWWCAWDEKDQQMRGVDRGFRGMNRALKSHHILIVRAHGQGTGRKGHRAGWRNGLDEEQCVQVRAVTPIGEMNALVGITRVGDEPKL